MREPAWWPMKEGPKEYDNSWTAIRDAIIEASNSARVSMEEFGRAFNREEDNG